MPKGGARPGAGNPGYGKQIAVREGVERLTPRWFELVEKMLNSKQPDERRFALSELGKLMGKLMPVEVTGKGGEPIKMTFDLTKATTDELLRFLTATGSNTYRVHV